MRETAVMARRVETDELDGVGVACKTIRFGLDSAADDALAENGGTCMVSHI